MSPFYNPDDVDLDEEDDFLEDLDGEDGLDNDLDEDLEDEGPRCVQCGCTEDDPCEGGCVWASATLCSRCA